MSAEHKKAVVTRALGTTITIELLGQARQASRFRLFARDEAVDMKSV
jgi:hypothetical protein